MNVFLTLLWKEWHNNLFLIILGASILLLPVLIVFSVMLGQGSEATLMELVSASLIFGATFGLILSQITLLCLGGHLIGAERMSRTFEFLFNQPVTRFSIVGSKLVFGFLVLLMIWGLGGGLMFIGFQLAGQNSVDIGIGRSWFAEFAVVGFLLFGSSWLVANKLDNSLLAITLGALVTTLTVMLATFALNRFDPIFVIDERDCSRVIALPIVAALMIACGVKWFTARKSP